MFLNLFEPEGLQETAKILIATSIKTGNIVDIIISIEKNAPRKDQILKHY